MNFETSSIVLAPGVGMVSIASPFPVPCSPFPTFLSAFSRLAA